MDTSHILLEIYQHMKTLYEACLKWNLSIECGQAEKLEENLEHMKFLCVILCFSADECFQVTLAEEHSIKATQRIHKKCFASSKFKRILGGYFCKVSSFEGGLK